MNTDTIIKSNCMLGAVCGDICGSIFEWDNINCKKSKKIISMFTFPFFMFTHIPISIIALFKRIGWAPIQHSISKSVEDIKKWCENYIASIYIREYDMVRQNFDTIKERADQLTKLGYTSDEDLDI